MPRRRRLTQSVTVAAVVLAATVACTQGSADQPATAEGTASAQEAAELATDNSFATALAEARDVQGVSQAQLDALERAAESGSMSYAELDALIADTFQCFDAAGVSYTRDPDYEVAPGFVAPAYSYTEPLAPADDCMNRNSFYAETAFQLQPAVVELRDEALEAERPRVLECLRDNGVEIDDDASADEIRQAALELFMATVDSAPVQCTEYM